jgi:hypothetical protein
MINTIIQTYRFILFLHCYYNFFLVCTFCFSSVIMTFCLFALIFEFDVYKLWIHFKRICVFFQNQKFGGNYWLCW